MCLCLLISLIRKTTVVLTVSLAKGLQQTAYDSVGLQGSSGRISLRGARCVTVMFLGWHVSSCPCNMLHDGTPLRIPLCSLSNRYATAVFFSTDSWSLLIAVLFSGVRRRRPVGTDNMSSGNLFPM